MWHNHFATGNHKVDDSPRCSGRTRLFRRLARASFGELLAAMGPRSGPACLARRAGQSQGAPQREPRPRADGAVHPGHRPLHRDRRQGGRPGPHRLDRDRGSVRRDPRPARRRRKTHPGPDGQVDRSRRRPDPPRPARDRPSAWPGGCATRSWARAPSIARRSRRWPMDCGNADLDIGWGVETILRSRAFFAEQNLGTRVLGPVEFIVGTARMRSSCSTRRPSTLVLADWCSRMGQDLFNPPNVGGWPGGRSWLSARSLIARATLRSPWSSAQASAATCRSTRSRWPESTLRGPTGAAPFVSDPAPSGYRTRRVLGRSARPALEAGTEWNEAQAAGPSCRFCRHPRLRSTEIHTEELQCSRDALSASRSQRARRCWP